MSRYTALFHIVFCTKYRKPTIPKILREDMYRYIWHDLKEMQCDLLRIGGIENHVHMLINLHPTVPLSKVIQNIKSRSSGWARKDIRFRNFEGWGEGYYACSVSPEHKDNIIEYIKGQEIHHHGRPIELELMDICHKAGIPYDNNYLQ